MALKEVLVHHFGYAVDREVWQTQRGRPDLRVSLPRDFENHGRFMVIEMKLQRHEDFNRPGIKQQNICQAKSYVADLMMKGSVDSRIQKRVSDTFLVLNFEGTPRSSEQKNLFVVTAAEVATDQRKIVRAGTSELNMVKVPAPEEENAPGANMGSADLIIQKKRADRGRARRHVRAQGDSRDGDRLHPAAPRRDVRAAEVRGARDQEADRPRLPVLEAAQERERLAQPPAGGLQQPRQGGEDVRDGGALQERPGDQGPARARDRPDGGGEQTQPLTEEHEDEWTINRAGQEQLKLLEGRQAPVSVPVSDSEAEEGILRDEEGNIVSLRRVRKQGHNGMPDNSFGLNFGIGPTDKDELYTQTQTQYGVGWGKGYGTKAGEYGFIRLTQKGSLLIHAIESLVVIPFSLGLTPPTYQKWKTFIKMRCLGASGYERLPYLVRNEGSPGERAVCLGICNGQGLNVLLSNLYGAILIATGYLTSEEAGHRKLLIGFGKRMYTFRDTKDIWRTVLNPVADLCTPARIQSAALKLTDHRVRSGCPHNKLLSDHDYKSFVGVVEAQGWRFPKKWSYQDNGCLEANQGPVSRTVAISPPKTIQEMDDLTFSPDAFIKTRSNPTISIECARGEMADGLRRDGRFKSDHFCFDGLKYGDEDLKTELNALFTSLMKIVLGAPDDDGMAIESDAGSEKMGDSEYSPSDSDRVAVFSSV